jgi:rod shape-determining protein MreC
MIISGNLSGWAAPQSAVAGAVTAPVQRVSSGFANLMGDIFSVFKINRELREENERLKEENMTYKEQLIDYQTLKEENRFYSEFLQIKNENPNFQFLPAQIISRDPTDVFCSFIIDKGVSQGVKQYNPVIVATADGLSGCLVGYISEAGLTQSKVITILSPELNAGALDRLTRDEGLVSGSLKAAEKGLCEMKLSRSASAAVGHLAVTTGAGGVYPKNLLIGELISVAPNSTETAIVAEIKPGADIGKLRNVMVLTAFGGN